jgi:CheY-like chemotaxis protein
MKKILLIEDDSAMQVLYQHAFFFAGYEIHIANDGIEGLEKVKEIGPDLILLDIMMPKMNGTEVLNALKHDSVTKNIPVLMLTNVASGTLEEAEESVKNGAVNYVIKSDHDPKEIVAMVTTILATQNA